MTSATTVRATRRRVRASRIRSPCQHLVRTGTSVRLSWACRRLQTTATAREENDLPDYLAERILAIADHVGESSPDIERLLEQLPLYDSYAQTGYLGIGITHLILEETIARIESQLDIDIS